MRGRVVRGGQRSRFRQRVHRRQIGRLQRCLSTEGLDRFVGTPVGNHDRVFHQRFLCSTQGEGGSVSSEHCQQGIRETKGDAPAPRHTRVLRPGGGP